MQAALWKVEKDLHQYWHAGTGKSSILRWHRENLPRDYPRLERLAFSTVLCIGEVCDRDGDKKQPILTCVDPIADITARIPLRGAVNRGTTHTEARGRFDKLRASWREQFRPWDW